MYRFLIALVNIMLFAAKFGCHDSNLFVNACVLDALMKRSAFLPFYTKNTIVLPIADSEILQRLGLDRKLCLLLFPSFLTWSTFYPMDE